MKKARRSPGEAERFAALATTLARPDAAWTEVLNALARWPEEQGAARAVEIVAAAAERWPAGTRGLSRLVVNQLLGHEVRPYLRLVRALDLRLLWRMPRRDGLLGRMIDEGGMTHLVAFTTRYDRGEALIAWLARRIGGLRSLHIGGSGVLCSGAQTLARAPGLAQLTSLSLHGNLVADAGAQALIDSPHLVELRYLNLYGNRLSSDGVRRLQAAPQWQEARVIVNHQRQPGSLGW